MYYAMTIKNSLITGVHESMTPITATTFAKNPAMADNEVIALEEPMEYASGMDIRAYNEDGTLKPPVWCIENDYMELPTGYEIIDGELVKTNVPEVEAPATLMDRIAKSDARMTTVEEVLDLIAEVML